MEPVERLDFAIVAVPSVVVLVVGVTVLGTEEEAGAPVASTDTEVETIVATALIADEGEDEAVIVVLLPGKT
jgi:hypothetical protein